ncbi:predicted protein [Sclerotinia sclerotiorum 1980 UF-70]|uniref:Uncharacterized protein n=1 Tax=Sclerotinia sclerotiorum (strain ATCC 18683 / 1980 / Ss-1) TaxID=665079 RepID=A7F5Y1_SCLS1|nr:predicted protein [Sclerotinia sclerotiorum 1980 UF-70]EDN98152.1 predicted protein [Sclerotinia sclerotiorum 1980 UF-70]
MRFLSASNGYLVRESMRAGMTGGEDGVLGYWLLGTSAIWQFIVMSLWGNQSIQSNATVSKNKASNEFKPKNKENHGLGPKNKKNH